MQFLAHLVQSNRLLYYLVILPMIRNQIVMMTILFFQETSGPDVSPAEKLEKVLQLAELCIELIQQNEEHHAEVN